jgi:hypothetical protein
LTIGNIPKAIRSKPTQQAQLLMGYILTTWLKHIKNKAAQRRALANLFHSCVHRVLLPLESYGETGIAMATGDGIWYCCHPILATFIGDYPKQLLIACTSNGRCPVTDLQGPPSERMQTEKIRDLKSLMGQYARDRGSCDNVHISYLEDRDNDNLRLAQMLAM